MGFCFYALLGFILWNRTSCENFIVGIMAFNSSYGYENYVQARTLSEYAYFGAAVPLAFDVARSKFSLLSNCSVDIVYSASQGSEKLALDTFIKLKQDHNVDALIGPTLSPECVPTAILASQWNVPMISHTCTSPVLSDSSRFNTFLRIYGTNSIANAVIAILQHFKWTVVAIVRTTDSLYGYEGEVIEAACRSVNISIGTFINDMNSRDSAQAILQGIISSARSKHLFKSIICCILYVYFSKTYTLSIFILI